MVGLGLKGGGVEDLGVDGSKGGWGGGGGQVSLRVEGLGW